MKGTCKDHHQGGFIIFASGTSTKAPEPSRTERVVIAELRSFNSRLQLCLFFLYRLLEFNTTKDQIIPF